MTAGIKLTRRFAVDCMGREEDLARLRRPEMMRARFFLERIWTIRGLNKNGVEKSTIFQLA
jgi:hypothetical protein